MTVPLCHCDNVQSSPSPSTTAAGAVTATAPLGTRSGRRVPCRRVRCLVLPESPRHGCPRFPERAAPRPAVARPARGRGGEEGAPDPRRPQPEPPSLI